MRYATMNGRLMSEYEVREAEAAEQRYKALDAEERFRKNAMPYVERGASFMDYAQNHYISEGDEERFNQLIKDHQRDEALSAAFLAGFGGGDGMPEQKKDDVKVVLE